MKPLHARIPADLRRRLMVGLAGAIRASQGSRWTAGPSLWLMSQAQERLALARFPHFAAKALAEARALPAAIALAETAVRDTVQRKRFSLHDNPPPTMFAPGTRPSDAAVDRALAAAIGALRDAGAQPFLAYGTLLGWAREGDFIPGDLDIDLGVFADAVTAPAVAAALEQAGFRLLWRTDPDWPAVIKAAHPEGVDLDVVFFKRRPEGFVTHMSLWGEEIRRVRRPFGLRPASFRGVEVFVPDPPEAFLDQNYGNWREPSVFYHFLLSPEIETDFTLPVVCLVARLTFLHELQGGTRARVRACLETLQRRIPDDPLWNWTRARLAAGDPSFSP